MEQQTEKLVLAKQSTQTLAFVEEQMQSLEKAMEFCDKMVQSRVLPKHYYNDNGSPKQESSGMLLVVLQMGKEIGMTQMQAIQQIIPVNGLMSVKGDGAKALIMASGKCAAWKEVEEGEGDNRRVTIYSKRKDNGEEISRSFSVEDAKRAGLWIDMDAVKRNERLKYSPWFKYGPRMLRYRALGFIARDLYSDVLQGIYVEEEARDIDNDISRSTADNGMVINANETNRQVVLEKAAIKSTTASKIVKKEAVKQELVKEEPKPIVEDVDFEEIAPEEPILVEEEEIDELMQHELAYVPTAKVKDLLTAKKDSCKEWISAMLQRNGISSSQNLFAWLGTSANIGNTYSLVLALRENNLNSFINDFGKTELNLDEINAKPSVKEEKPIAKKVEHAKTIEIPELVMGTRDFNQQFALQSDLKSLGFTTPKIEGYIESKGLQMSAAEFIANGTSDLILEMINS
jgi:hypothetical protein